MKKRLVVFVCGLEIMQQVLERGPVKRSQLAFDIHPDGLRFLLTFRHRISSRAGVTLNDLPYSEAVVLLQPVVPVSGRMAVG